MELKSIEAGVLEIAYLDDGPKDGWPCILGHGFPYDVNAYEHVTPILANAGARVIVPYLRGYGPTRFLSTDTPRSGEQAALGADLLALMDALKINRAIIGGYDWGGRAACVVSALWPERVVALVSGNSYNIQNIADAMVPISATEEASLWYQYYFHSERGRQGLTKDRRGIALQLWKMWSLKWDFDKTMFEASASSFDNPDFVDVVIHSYRHRFGLAAGDPAVAGIEERLAQQPKISVPTISIDGDADGVNVGTAHHVNHFEASMNTEYSHKPGTTCPKNAPPFGLKLFWMLVN